MIVFFVQGYPSELIVICSITNGSHHKMMTNYYCSLIYNIIFIILIYNTIFISNVYNNMRSQRYCAQTAFGIIRMKVFNICFDEFVLSNSRLRYSDINF